MLKLSIITLFLGPQANRFLHYQEPRSTGERLDLIGRIDGCDGVELRYPADFEDLGAIKAGLDRNGLAVSAINFASVRPGKWMRGAWTSENPADRREAVDDFKRAVDIAFELDANRLTAVSKVVRQVRHSGRVKRFHEHCHCGLLCFRVTFREYGCGRSGRHRFPPPLKAASYPGKTRDER